MLDLLPTLTALASVTARDGADLSAVVTGSR